MCPLCTPLMEEFGVTKALVCTYQAISGAGKTFATWPEMVDNCIPYIGGEEEKSEQEPLKLWGHIEGDRIVSAASPAITAQCLRIPVSDGHMAAVFLSFANKPTKEQILDKWAKFAGPRAGAESAQRPPSSSCTTLRKLTGRRPRLDRDTRKRHGCLHRPPARGYPVRLQVCMPFPQYASRRCRRRGASGRTAGRQGIF